MPEARLARTRKIYRPLISEARAALKAAWLSGEREIALPPTLFEAYGAELITNERFVEGGIVEPHGEYLRYKDARVFRMT